MGIDKLEVDGNTVSLSTFVQASMPKDPIDKERAIGHLRDIGAEDFIKNQVQISFGINQDNSARSLQAELEDKGHDTTARTWVEPSTLKKLVRERVEANQPIDLELFKAYVGQTAKIKGENNMAEKLPDLMKAFESDVGSGFEEVTSSDIQIPFLRLIQALSPQLKSLIRLL